MTAVDQLRVELEHLGSRYTAEAGEFHLSGVQALVRLPPDQLRADRRRGLATRALISGYQGSPLGGLDIELSSQRPLLSELGIVHQPGLNEELAATAVMGSQIASTFDTFRGDGVVGVWYGKGPGLDRATDAIRHANYVGTSPLGGVVALVGDDPSCKSSTIPSASEQALADLAIPVFFPGNIDEILDLGRHAISLSRVSGLWTALKMVTAVADGVGGAEVAPWDRDPVVPSLEYHGAPFRPRVRPNFYGIASEIEAEIFEARLPMAAAYAEANGINKVSGSETRTPLGIVASGYTYHEVVEALRRLGMEASTPGLRLLQLGMIYPVNEAEIRGFARGLDEIVVIEEKRSFIEAAVKSSLYGIADAPLVVGKSDLDGTPLIGSAGVLTADSLIAPLTRVLTRRLPGRELNPAAGRPPRARIALAARTPYVCSGCPHSTSLQVPAGALVGAGIGCHGLVSVMDPKRFGTVVGYSQMGGEGASWIGIEPFVGTDHLFQNMGDGTFFHSGSLAVRAAVAANSHLTFKILYNSAVAMTGGQDVSGSQPVLALAGGLLLEGVKRVIVTTDDPKRYGKSLPLGTSVWDRSRIIEAQETLKAIPGVTVLIHDQECAAELRRKRKRGNAPVPRGRVYIDERVCEGCGDCGRVSNCLSVQPVETEFGRKTRIDQSTCNFDYSCVAGDCPAFVTVLEPKRTKARPPKRPEPPLLPELAEPDSTVGEQGYTIRMPGVGGTGVVTVSRVLGMAAMLEGKHVWGLDQTGLSQKAGPVVSEMRISAAPIDGSNHAGGGQVDLLLIFDLLAAQSELAGASATRTVAVASTSLAPTGQTVTDVSADLPTPAQLTRSLEEVTRDGGNVYLDASALSESTLGVSTYANFFVVGAALQSGYLPLSAAAIERAIDINATSVKENINAFRQGRTLVGKPGSLPSEVPDPSPVTGSLDGLIASRAKDLRAYQGKRLADAYLELVQRVRSAEGPAQPGSQDLTEAVARYAYKLMAYKDEYEVARLLLASPLGRGHDGLKQRVQYHLQPPVLKHLGLDRKIRLGGWSRPVLRLLVAGRRLRGTRLDPFGRTEVRKLERALWDEYVTAVSSVAERLTTANHDLAVQIARLPDMVRGYERLKLENAAAYRDELSEALSRYDQAPVASAP